VRYGGLVFPYGCIAFDYIYWIVFVILFYNAIPEQLQMSETILNILRYKESRSSMISLLANFLESNSKRTQMQVEEDKVSKDGFMLNLLSCLYDLCIDKIPYTKVGLQLCEM